MKTAIISLLMLSSFAQASSSLDKFVGKWYGEKCQYYNSNLGKDQSHYSSYPAGDLRDEKGNYLEISKSSDGKGLEIVGIGGEFQALREIKDINKATSVKKDHEHYPDESPLFDDYYTVEKNGTTLSGNTIHHFEIDKQTIIRPFYVAVKNEHYKLKLNKDNSKLTLSKDENEGIPLVAPDDFSITCNLEKKP